MTTWPSSPWAMHARREGAQAIHHAPEVDAHHPVPVVLRLRPDRPPGPAAGDAGVVADHVQLAEPRLGRVGQPLDRLVARRRRPRAARPRSWRGSAGRPRAQRLALDVGHGDLHAAAGERLGHSEADPARRPGDDRDLPSSDFILAEPSGPVRAAIPPSPLAGEGGGQSPTDEGCRFDVRRLAWPNLRPSSEHPSSGRSAATFSRKGRRPPDGDRDVAEPHHASNTMTERAIWPVFISAKASLMSSSLMRRLIISSSFSLPDM